MDQQTNKWLAGGLAIALLLSVPQATSAISQAESDTFGPVPFTSEAEYENFLAQVPVLAPGESTGDIKIGMKESHYFRIDASAKDEFFARLNTWKGSVRVFYYDGYDGVSYSTDQDGTDERAAMRFGDIRPGSYLVRVVGMQERNEFEVRPMFAGAIKKRAADGEPNDVRGNAFLLKQSGTYKGYLSDEWDVDWLKLDGKKNETIFAQVKSPYGYRFELSDEEGNVIYGYSLFNARYDYAYMTPKVDGPFFLKVYSFGGKFSTKQPYSLTYRAKSIPDPTFKVTDKSGYLTMTGKVASSSTVRVYTGTKAYVTKKTDSKGNYSLKFKKPKKGTALSLQATDRFGNKTQPVGYRVN